MVKYARGDQSTPINIPILQTFQSAGTNKIQNQPHVIESAKGTHPLKAGIDRTDRVATSHNRDSHYHNANYNSSKGLTLKQLKDVIEEIYDSKLKFDEKNYHGKLAR